MNSIIGFFDLFSRFRGTQPRAQAIEAGQIAVWRQWVIYGCCFLGILLAPFVPIALAGGPDPTLEQIFRSPWTVIWALVFSCVLVAGLFKIFLSPKQGLIVHVGVALAAGMVFRKLVPFIINSFFPGAGTS